MCELSRLAANSKGPERVHNSRRFVGLGETLFDVFEDGTATLGGAPLNVALHAHQLATTLSVGEGIVVSRVGTDIRGMEILKSLLERGMTTGYVQTDPVHPTGTVSVFMRGGEPCYQIECDAAWDFLKYEEKLEKLAQSCDAVCFGSLAQRSSESRETIRAFLALAKNAVRLYDVNLRRNTLTQECGYSAEVIQANCALATIVKVNCNELFEIADLFGVNTGCSQERKTISEIADRLMKRLSVPVLIVTNGALGTTLYAPDGEFHGNLPLVTVKDVYPVGAGDACTAGILFATVFGFTPNEAVDLGNRMGAWVASHRSATPKLSDEIVTFIGTLEHTLNTREVGSLG
jgi:fructokinase